MKALKECFNDRTYIVKLFLYGSHLSVSEYVDLISCKKYIYVYNNSRVSPRPARPHHFLCFAFRERFNKSAFKTDLWRHKKAATNNRCRGFTTLSSISDT